MKTPRQRKAKILVNGKKDMYVRENFKRLQEGNDRMNLIILRSLYPLRLSTKSVCEAKDVKRRIEDIFSLFKMGP